MPIKNDHQVLIKGAGIPGLMLGHVISVGIFLVEPILTI